MAARSVEFWPSLEGNFSGVGCALEAEAAVGGSTWCCLFIGDFKKYTVSGVTYSFKQPRRQRQGKRHFKNDFQIFQTSSR